MFLHNWDRGFSRKAVPHGGCALACFMKMCWRPQTRSILGLFWGPKMVQNMNAYSFGAVAWPFLRWKMVPMATSPLETGRKNCPKKRQQNPQLHPGLLHGNTKAKQQGELQAASATNNTWNIWLMLCSTDLEPGGTCPVLLMFFWLFCPSLFHVFFLSNVCWCVFAVATIFVSGFCCHCKFQKNTQKCEATCSKRIFLVALPTS